MESIKIAAIAARKASRVLGVMGTAYKNNILAAIAKGLVDNAEFILEKNLIDIENARAKGKTDAMLDRLRLSSERIQDMATGMLKVVDLDDPVGEVINTKLRPNGLRIGKKRVPLGVIGIIYEARPNVSADAIALCVKTGNGVILKGGSEAIASNAAIVKIAIEAGKQAGLPNGAIHLIEDTSRAAAEYLMKLNGYVDVLIPRGGAGLIRSVVENANVPVIETGTGNCHIYADKSCDLNMAKDIIVNAKTSRPAVCNAAETLLVHKDIADEFLPMAFEALKNKNVELRGCEVSQRYGTLPATEEDYYTEFLDYILAVKVVDGIDEAIEHIDKYSTHHSECIVTSDYSNAKRFQDEVDSAAVYVNASTRYTDGFEFGFGAEIGISTQKLHARGPMGLPELTTIKYIIDGDGQIR